jgi:N-acyl-D-glutamate deacylase
MGMNMWAEYYPYAAGSTSIASEQLKPEAVKALGLKYKDIMFDPAENRFLTEEEYLKISKEDPGRTVIVFNPPRVEWMKSWIKIPHMVVGSDAMWSTDPSQKWDTDPSEFAGHPRTSGSHSTVLQMGREAGVPLMFTLAQLSYWSAVPLGKAGIEAMDVRGRMQEGMVADIVIFNPKTVKAGSSYKKGEQGLPPIGMPHVIVNGVFVKQNNKATDKFPGQPIRYAEEKESRHVPTSQKQWLKSFTIDSSPLVPKAKSAKEQPKAEKTSSVDSAPDHEPFARPTVASLDPLDPSFLRVDQTLSGEQQWFGDRPYRSLGYCCDFHWQQARLAVMNRVTALSTED